MPARQSLAVARNAVLTVALIGTLLTACLYPKASAADSHKAYHRAIVFSGGGLNPGMFIGMMDALEDEGLGPDLVIGSCGGSVAAAIINAFPTRQERLQYLVSMEFYTAFASLNFKRTDVMEQILPVVAGVFADKYIGHIPDLYGDAVATYDINRLAHSLQQPFSAAPDRVHAVIVAERLDFAREEIGTPMGASEKLFTETYFTDSKTAAALRGFRSPIAVAYPGSRVQTETETISDVSLADALRGSVADPFLLTPGEVSGHSYLTGAGDLWPYELAQYLAEETVVTTSTPFNVAEQAGFNVTFNVPMNARLAEVKKSAGTYWIDDGSYFSSKNPANIGKFRLDAKLTADFFLDAESKLSAVSYAEFQKLMIEQWEAGRALVREHLVRR